MVITNGKNKPTKNITKHLKQIKIYPPTKSDVSNWLKLIGSIKKDDEVYDKDWRKVIRNFLHY